MEEALDWYYKLLGILQNISEPDDNKSMRVLQSLAVLLRNNGDLTQAEPLQQDSVARFVRAHGEDALEFTAAYCGLGVLLNALGDFEKVEQYYRKALTIRERELGPDADSTTSIQVRLTDLLKAVKSSEKQK